MRALFETATLADCLKKAAAVAPAKGQAFDKAAGIVLDLSPESCVIKATNLEVFYTEWIDAVDVDENMTWRLPSVLLASVIGSLPIGSGKTVVLEQKNNTIYIEQGRTKARINLLPLEYYPIWTAFDPEVCVDAGRFADRLKQVQWAASGNAADHPFNGIHVSGEIIVATDRYRIAAVPLVIPGLQKPVTVPGGPLVAALGRSGDVKLGSEGDQLLIMPDEHTQVRAVCYGQEYPKYQNVMKRDQPESITCNRTSLLEIMNRALTFSGSERTPVMRVFIGQEEIAVMMTNTEVGLLGDVVEVPGYATHARIEFTFTPKNLMDALGASPNDHINLYYNPAYPGKPLRIDGGSGYEAWIAPRKHLDGS